MIARRTRTRTTAALAAVALLGLAACSDDAEPGADATTPAQTTSGAAATEAPTTSTESELEGSLTVFAAASLEDVFSDLAQEFQAEHPGVVITFSFGGSPELVTQIVEGARADVLATANESTMATAVDEGVADAPTIFATNTLTIAVRPGNPQGITGLADLTDAKLVLALCEPTVPCGSATDQVLEVAGLTLEPDSLEPDVRTTMLRVQLDGADAAIVYKTDVIQSKTTIEPLDAVDFPESEGVVNAYPVATTTETDSPEIAQAFVDFVLSEIGADALEEHGFGLPG